MRQVVNGKRSRGRSSRKSGSPRNPTFDSSGPEGKVRGTANQVFEKYLALARDAQSSGDRIAAENFFQHAEHYFRIMNANAQAHAERSRQMVNGGMPGMEAEAGAGSGGFPIPPAADDPAPDGPALQDNAEAESADSAEGDGEARPSRRRRAQRRAAAEQEEAGAGQQGA